MRAKSKKLKDFMRGLEHKKKLEAKEQKKEAKKLIFTNAYNDPLKHETVSRSSTDEILTQMSKKFEAVILASIPEVEKGLVLQNDYGHGFYQGFGGAN